MWDRNRLLEEVLGWAGIACMVAAAYLAFGRAGALVVVGLVLLAASHHYYTERTGLT